MRSVVRPILHILLFCLPPRADEAPLHHAGRLLAEGRFGAAEAILRAHRSANSAEETLRVWLLAMSHINDGAPRKAIPYLEQLVSVAPGVVRFRLELARALYLVEQDDRARFHFEQAMGGDISARDEAAVRGFLDRMERRKSWEARLRFAIVPESNPFRRTAAETVSIGGWDFALDPEARAEPATGVKLGGDVAWLPTIAPNTKARLGFSIDGQVFENSAYNDISARAQIGFLRLGDRGVQVGAGVTFQQRDLGGQTFSRGPGLYLTYQQRLSRRTLLGLTVDHARLSYPGRASRDGERTSINLRLSHVVSPKLSLHGGLMASSTDARADFHSARAGPERGGAIHVRRRPDCVGRHQSVLADLRRGASAVSGTARG